MTRIPVVLASSSPRRRQLLELLALAPEAVRSGVDEIWREGEAPAAHAERLAREKAVAVRREGAVVVAADTIVVIDGVMLGKPGDSAEAAGMLRRLSGRDHLVHTAVAVCFGGRLASGVETTRVWFVPLDERSIADYVATGEPMDKAGAYGIQGFGSVLVERVEGDFFTVMGLGLSRLIRLFEEVGLSYRFGNLERLG